MKPMSKIKVILLMAQTLDGKIARDSEHFPDWTGKADKKLFQQVTKKAGVMIMGRKTYDTIGRPLPQRLSVVMTRQNLESENENLIYSNKTPQETLKMLEQKGYDEVVLAGGTQINTIFAKENLIDEVWLTFSPIIFGSGGLGVFAEGVSVKMALINTEILDEKVFLARYQVVRL